ncbi:MAG TPA: T9SS type A sorting domain-containing protein [Bacteroidia bacterium]|nr:T9SS type A sorting domain-containing protein [Bacteroidia bacterium]
MKKILILLFCLLAVFNARAQQDTLFRYISAIQTSDGVLLQFTIVGGITCTGVKIERSGDGELFETVHEFVGVCGSVTVDESYSFLDRNPEPNHLNYYRLELGSLGLFSDPLKVLYLDFSGDGVVVAPQPCHETCTIWFPNFSNEKHLIKLYDTTGKKVLEESGGDNHFSVPCRSLLPGIYFFNILKNTEIRYSGRLLVL